MTTKTNPAVEKPPADKPDEAPAEQAVPKPDVPAAMTPEEAVAKAVETVRAPYEAVREAQAKAAAEAAAATGTEPKG